MRNVPAVSSVIIDVHRNITQKKSNLHVKGTVGLIPMIRQYHSKCQKELFLALDIRSLLFCFVYRIDDLNISLSILKVSILTGYTLVDIVFRLKFV